MTDVNKPLKNIKVLILVSQIQSNASECVDQTMQTRKIQVTAKCRKNAKMGIKPTQVSHWSSMSNTKYLAETVKFLADRLCLQGHCSQHCFCLHFSRETCVLSPAQTAPAQNQNVPGYMLKNCCTFITRDSIYAIARICHGNSVCLSVCLSITRVDQSKTVEARITQFSLYSSPIPLVFRG